MEGISKVITKLTDALCPTALDEYGIKVPIFPTTFSGDQKTEKSARSAQVALMDNGSMRDKLNFIVGRHELLHYMFMLTDVGLDLFADNENIEEASSLSRLIKLLNPKLEKKKGKDNYYGFRDLYSDIFFAQLGDFLRNFLHVQNLEENATPYEIRQEKDIKKRQEALKILIRTFVRSLDEEYNKCKEFPGEKLPLFYPHEKFLRNLKINPTINQAGKIPSDTPDKSNIKPVKKLKNSKSTEASEKPDHKNSYARSLFSFLGFYHLMLDSIKEGNGLNCFLIQKKLHKTIYSTGHKNYACSVSSYKQVVLGHPSPQFSHRYMWNIFAGRGGKSLKFARDQKNEHLNHYLKTCFRSLGVNLNEKNAHRINNSADVGVKMESKVADFFQLDSGGKSHTKKDRTVQIRKVMEIFKNDNNANVVPGRKFNGPVPSQFDEAEYRSWHLLKDKELAKISEIRFNYFC